MEQGCTEVMNNADDVANNDSDDDYEFTDDEDDLVMMTPTVTMSQKIAPNLLQQRFLLRVQCLLRIVPKNC
jgi:hypothetical protein